MDEKEIREAVRIATIDNERWGSGAVQILLSLASDYLAVGVVEEKECTCDSLLEDTCTAHSYNAALHSCKLAMLKAVSEEELEKIMGNIVNRGLDDGKDTATLIHEQAQAIHQAIVGNFTPPHKPGEKG
jgi:hypothetical protein